jgi:tRNA threonylcarbamoyladenosine biosynthesis protein TsaB
LNAVLTLPVILCIETAGPSCSVCISQEKEILSSERSETFQQHASQLTPMIESSLLAAGLKYSDLQAVAVSSGPGSYTGLRVGLAAAKGICVALDLPLISIPSLSVLASALQAYARKGNLICPMIDARRMEVYMAVHRPDLSILSEPEAHVLSAESLKSFNANRIIVGGSGAGKFQKISNRENVHFQSAKLDALHMVMLACQAFEESNFENTSVFSPLYLKSPNITIPRDRPL